jgi:hypothetical protein
LDDFANQEEWVECVEFEVERVLAWGFMARSPFLKEMALNLRIWGFYGSNRVA